MKLTLPPLYIQATHDGFTSMVDQTMEKSVVSVIMPAFNAQKFVKASITSVLTQTYPNIELIVIDDGSTDGTRGIIERAIFSDERARLLCLDECSGGPATPRNVGLRSAIGSYIAFIDADDQWHSQKLEMQLSAISEHGLDFVSTGLRLVESAEQPSWPAMIGGNRISYLSHRMMLRKNRVVTSSAVVSRTVLNSLSFNEGSEFVAIEDYLLWLQILESQKVAAAVLNEPLVFYRLRSDSLSNSKLEMASKIFNLLGVYQVNGASLGIKKYYYFACYVVQSVWLRLLRPKR